MYEMEISRTKRNIVETLCKIFRIRPFAGINKRNKKLTKRLKLAKLFNVNSN